MVRHWMVRSAVAAAVLATGALGWQSLQAQGGAALTGTVSSAKEGKMEGVLVTARLDGANYDVTVVSDAAGKYSFPRTHLKDAGKYAIKIRAVGYDLTSANTVDLAAGKTATLDLTPAGTKVDALSMVAPAIGTLTGDGTVSAKGDLDFRMLAKLKSAPFGVPFTIAGTTADPVFRPDLGRVVKNAAGDLKNAAKDVMQNPDNVKKAADALLDLFGRRKQQ